MRIKTGPYSVILGGFEMAYRDTETNAGVDVSDIAGWFDLPDVRSSIVDRVGTSGGFDGKPLYSSRVITLTGTLTGATQGEVIATRDTLAGILYTGDLITLTVDHEEVGELSVAARPSAAPNFAPAGGSTSMDFSITLTAPDPLKYGSLVFGSTDLSGQVGTGLVYPRVYPLDYGVPQGQTPGSVPVGNTGEVAYWPRLRIDGPVTNPVVTCNETGDWVRYNGTVLAGQWLDILAADRRVLLNGVVSVRQNVTSHGSWLFVPPSGASFSWAADTADPAAALSVWSYEGAWP